ncbi:hypothetical protein [Planctomyces sp. SH-PL62]|uniref:hypothetical protein n=1 Tax=Planctomyces sp. SH-PL62 TaxID=1636152 RepID=UPI00078DA7AA|nr:hypothetical protein [Planctomyces sp. SH-PL62]AMV39320.1 hypothetical protein VT85_17925 [Planctomyces sp. SH-PL62]
MMHRDDTRAVSAGIWLIGIGLLLASRQFWPGILFLAGAVSLVQAYAQPRRRSAARAGIILILVGFWAIMRFSLPFFLVAIGVWMILTSAMTTAPSRKPYIDQTLD